MVTTDAARAPQTQPATWRGSVALVAKAGAPNTGVGRYAHALERSLRACGADSVRLAPSLPPLPRAGYRALRRLGVDLAAFLANYPVWARYPQADVYHLTSQNLATLLLFRRPRGKVVVTVHDIIPYMLRDIPQLCPYRTAADRLFDRLAMAGLSRADRLVADSQYTRACVVAQLGVAPEKIEVVYLGVDHGRFRPRSVPDEVRARYDLPEGRSYLIYVGSEDPRKNLPALVEALAGVRQQLGDVELIKVGRAQFERERRQLLAIAEQHGIGRAIRFLGDVPEDDLPALYCLADLCVMPSLYEGFGFPVLEALACGTPVVAARATSIPEVAGAAALLVDDSSPEALSAAIVQMLRAPWPDLAERTAQAARFSWDATGRAMLGVYGRALGRPEEAP